MLYILYINYEKYIKTFYFDMIVMFCFLIIGYLWILKHNCEVYTPDWKVLKLHSLVLTTDHLKKKKKNPIHIN